MNIASRPATTDDIDTLVVLYRELEKEQAALRPMWPFADGVPEPAGSAFTDILDAPDSQLVIGELDGAPLGFAWGRIEELLPQADGRRVGVVRLIHTVYAARGVGIGDAMVEHLLAGFRREGLHLFDARVSPGHRHAKNFFEAHGFSARLIVMHHDDRAAERAEET